MILAMDEKLKSRVLYSLKFLKAGAALQEWGHIWGHNFFINL
jgi:hypothetical protein